MTVVRISPKQFVLPEPSVLRVSKAGDSFVVEGPPKKQFGAFREAPTDGAGVGGVWEWDGSRLTVRVDRYGMWPLFYYADTRQILVSDSLHALVQRLESPKLDTESLPIFLRLGFFLREDTPFKDVKVMPPKGELTWDGTFALTTERPIFEAVDEPYDRLIDRYIELFRQSMTRCLRRGRPTAMPLSGGRDSRHIAFELARQDALPDEFVTTGYVRAKPGTDIGVAQQVARALNVKHTTVEMGGSRHRWELAKNEATHFCSDEHTWISPAFAYLARRTDCLFDGIAGDVLSESRFLTRERVSMALDPQRLAQNVINHFGHEKRLLRIEPFLGPRIDRETPLEALAQEIGRYRDAANPISAFFFWNRTRREIALSPFGVGRAVPNALCPYLDPDLFQFLSSIPAERLVDRRLHSDAIARAYPEWDHIPYNSQREERTRVPFLRKVADLRKAAEQAAWFIHGVHYAPQMTVDNVVAGAARRLGRPSTVSRSVVTYLAQLQQTVQRAQAHGVT